MPDEQYAAAAELWEKYRLLTHELIKFIDGEEIDTFINLVDQREQIVDLIRALPADPYKESAAWEAFDAEVRPLEMQIGYKARAWLNKSRRQNAAVHSYDLSEVSPLGSVLNKRY
ncbi:flagellar protein FliT [Selenomonas artemidis]|uniref:flagellar protein FliT n=1 Tax=Selenomonas artemidis TaxID=671224 RepID=UPI0023F02151|nr:flagellar protein FliT [Selenomonas artemidis]